MRPRQSVFEYLSDSETLTPQELVWGVVREAPAPFCGHQSLVGRIFAALHEHVSAGGLGEVFVAPTDVVLDGINALVVQPDIAFVAAARTHIIRRQIWGAPDLTVEVLSRSTAARDRDVKVGWYRDYGVRECWLADEQAQTVEVLAFAQGGRRETFAPSDILHSAVLQELALPVDQLFPRRPDGRF